MKILPSLKFDYITQDGLEYLDKDEETIKSRRGVEQFFINLPLIYYDFLQNEKEFMLGLHNDKLVLDFKQEEVNDYRLALKPAESLMVIQNSLEECQYYLKVLEEIPKTMPLENDCESIIIILPHYVRNLQLAFNYHCKASIILSSFKDGLHYFFLRQEMINFQKLYTYLYWVIQRINNVLYNNALSDFANQSFRFEEFSFNPHALKGILQEPLIKLVNQFQNYLMRTKGSLQFVLQPMQVRAIELGMADKIDQNENCFLQVRKALKDTFFKEYKRDIRLSDNINTDLFYNTDISQMREALQKIQYHINGCKIKCENKLVILSQAITQVENVKRIHQHLLKIKDGFQEWIWHIQGFSKLLHQANNSLAAEFSVKKQSEKILNAFTCFRQIMERLNTILHDEDIGNVFRDFIENLNQLINLYNLSENLSKDSMEEEAETKILGSTKDFKKILPNSSPFITENKIVIFSRMKEINITQKRPGHELTEEQDKVESYKVNKYDYCTK